MKIPTIARVKRFRLLFPALVAALIFGCRCSVPKPSADPLAGWQKDFSEQPDKAIVDDYTAYLKTLPTKEQQFARVSDWRKDASGMHAIVIEIALNGTWWHHVIIYNKDDVRVKVIKYSPGKYRS